MNWKTDVMAWLVGLVVVVAIIVEGFVVHSFYKAAPHAQAVHFDSWQFKDGAKASYTITVGTGGPFRGITCCAEGACWNARKNGMCFLADKSR